MSATCFANGGGGGGGGPSQCAGTGRWKVKQYKTELLANSQRCPRASCCTVTFRTHHWCMV